MVNCEQALSQLLDYLDHELDAARHQEMEAHLHACRACFSRAEFERHLKTKLVAIGREPTPTTLAQRVKGLLHRF